MAKKFLNIADIDVINIDALVKLLPAAPRSLLVFGNKNRRDYILALLTSWDVLDKEGINTPIRLGHFIGQGLVETGWLVYSTENLKAYTAKNLLNIFKKYYKGDEELAKKHAGNEELIGNLVYGGRLGNDQPGDGFKYRGRGFFQITGKTNYKAFADVSGVDLVTDPDMISRDLKASVKVAAAYWRANGLSAYADANNASAISRGINLGNPKSAVTAHGEDQRILWTNTVLGLLKNPVGVVNDPNAPLTIGSKGPKVVELQKDLLALGFAGVGTADGVFGKDTRVAVLGFQDRAGLEKTGIADAATVTAVDEATRDARNNPASPFGKSMGLGYA